MGFGWSQIWHLQCLGVEAIAINPLATSQLKAITHCGECLQSWRSAQHARLEPGWSVEMNLHTVSKKICLTSEIWPFMRQFFLLTVSLWAMAGGKWQLQRVRGWLGQGRVAKGNCTYSTKLFWLTWNGLPNMIGVVGVSITCIQHWWGCLQNTRGKWGKGDRVVQCQDFVPMRRNDIMRLTIMSFAHKFECSSWRSGEKATWHCKLCGWQTVSVGHCQSDCDVHCHMVCIFVYPSPYNTLIQGSTVLPSTVAIRYHAVYRPSHIPDDTGSVLLLPTEPVSPILLVIHSWLIVNLLYCSSIYQVDTIYPPEFCCCILSLSIYQLEMWSMRLKGANYCNEPYSTLFLHGLRLWKCLGGGQPNFTHWPLTTLDFFSGCCCCPPMMPAPPQQQHQTLFTMPVH